MKPSSNPKRSSRGTVVHKPREERKFYKLEEALFTMLRPLQTCYITSPCIRQFATSLAKRQSYLLSKSDGSVMTFRASDKWVKNFKCAWGFSTQWNPGEQVIVKCLMPQVLVIPVDKLHPNTYINAVADIKNDIKDKKVLTSRTKDSNSSNLACLSGRAAVKQDCSSSKLDLDLVKSDTPNDFVDLRLYPDGLIGVDEILAEFNNDEEFFDSIIRDICRDKLS